MKITIFNLFFTLAFFQIGLAQKTTVIHLAAPAFDSLVLEGKGLILDVRTAAEYEGWHYEKAVLVNYFGKGFKKKIRALDKSRPVYVYCHSGIRSGLSLSILRKQGFPKIYNLKGGTIALKQLITEK